MFGTYGTYHCKLELFSAINSFWGMLLPTHTLSTSASSHMISLTIYLFLWRPMRPTNIHFKTSFSYSFNALLYSIETYGTYYCKLELFSLLNSFLGHVTDNTCFILFTLLILFSYDLFIHLPAFMETYGTYYCKLELKSQADSKIYWMYEFKPTLLLLQGK